jgi:hypothetical protein
MPIEPYRFELVFTGLCLFVLDNQGATVLLVNASNPKRFQADPDLSSGSRPDPHFPHLSYIMSQQIRSGVVPRLPNRVFAGPSGEEIGVCDLEGEDLSLELPGASNFQAGSLGQAPKLSDLLPVRLSGLASSEIPNYAVATRIRFTQGTLDTLRIGFAGLNPLEIDFRTISTLGTPSANPPQKIVDQMVLRAENLTEPVRIRSRSRPSVVLRPDLDSSGTGLRSVSVSLANFHQEFHQPRDAAYDFLWFYEVVEFTSLGPRPSRRDLLIPFHVNGSGGFTGSSAVCPPIRF